MKVTVLSMVVLVAAALAGCSDSGIAEHKTASARREYQLTGKVVAVDRKQAAVTLDHEDIPGLMKAMQMEFRVEDPKHLESVKPGDRVQGRLRRDESGYVVTDLKKAETRD